MKILSILCRVVLGLVFVLSGLNGFIRFGHAPVFSTALGRDYMALMLAPCKSSPDICVTKTAWSWRTTG